MKKNTIELSDFQKFLAEEDVVYARSSRENKSLVCSLNGTLTVIVAGKIAYQGMQPFPAVEAYNEATTKYINPIKDFKL